MGKSADKKPNTGNAKAAPKAAPKTGKKHENEATKHLREALERLHAKQHQASKDAAGKEAGGGPDTKHNAPTAGRLFRHQGR